MRIHFDFSRLETRALNDFTAECVRYERAAIPLIAELADAFGDELNRRTTGRTDPPATSIALPIETASDDDVQRMGLLMGKNEDQLQRLRLHFCGALFALLGAHAVDELQHRAQVLN